MFDPTETIKRLQSWKHEPVFAQITDPDKWAYKIAPLGKAVKGFQAPTFGEMRTFSEQCMDKIAPLGEAMKSIQVPTSSEMGAFNKQLMNKIAPLLEEVMKDLRVLKLNDIERFHKEHPVLVASAGIGLIVVGTALILPIVGSVTANAAGFSSTGPVAGSVAAGFQSSVYGAATGGVFSAIQSFAMTTAPSAVSVIAGGGMIAAGITFLRGEKTGHLNSIIGVGKKQPHRIDVYTSARENMELMMAF